MSYNIYNNKTMINYNNNNNNNNNYNFTKLFKVLGFKTIYEMALCIKKGVLSPLCVKFDVKSSWVSE